MHWTQAQSAVLEDSKKSTALFLVIKHKSIFGTYNPNSKIESKSNLLVRPKRPVDGTVDRNVQGNMYKKAKIERYHVTLKKKRNR